MKIFFNEFGFLPKKPGYRCVDRAQWTFRKLGNAQVRINVNVKKCALNNII